MHRKTGVQYISLTMVLLDNYGEADVAFDKSGIPNRSKIIFNILIDSDNNKYITKSVDPSVCTVECVYFLTHSIT